MKCLGYCEITQTSSCQCNAKSQLKCMSLIFQHIPFQKSTSQTSPWKKPLRTMKPDTKIRFSTESWPWRIKFSCHSCWDSNPKPLDPKSVTLSQSHPCSPSCNHKLQSHKTVWNPHKLLTLCNALSQLPVYSVTLFEATHTGCMSCIQL